MKKDIAKHLEEPAPHARGRAGGRSIELRRSADRAGWAFDVLVRGELRVTVGVVGPRRKRFRAEMSPALAPEGRGNESSAAKPSGG